MVDASMRFFPSLKLFRLLQVVNLNFVLQNALKVPVKSKCQRKLFVRYYFCLKVFILKITLKYHDQNSQVTECIDLSSMIFKATKYVSMRKAALQMTSRTLAYLVVSASHTVIDPTLGHFSRCAAL